MLGYRSSTTLPASVGLFFGHDQNEELARAVVRFWAKVDKRGPDDCWNWTGGKVETGYGHFQFGKQMGAHRVSVMLSGREIPRDRVVHHICSNRACVNPAHLEVTTQLQNVLSGELLRRAKERTVCGRGHQYTPETTRVSATGSKRCILCEREWKREHYQSVKRRVQSVEFDLDEWRAGWKPTKVGVLAQ